MAAPNDLVSVTITRSTGNQVVIFKPSQFIAAVSVYGTSYTSTIYIYLNVEDFVAASPSMSLTNFTAGESADGVALIYAAVDAYYTAINA